MFEKRLRDEEGGRTRFEESRRSALLRPAAAFKDGRMTRPIRFRKGERMLPLNAHIPREFPNMDLSVLEASGTFRTRTGKKMRVAVMFSGGPAAGGHNVLCGIRDALGGNNVLLGARGGPDGFLKGDLVPVDDLDRIRNTGGFDFLGTGRTKITKEVQIAGAAEVCRQNGIDAIIIIGGDDSNTNAAILAERLAPDVQVIGVPKTVDADLQAGDMLPCPFGFDTAASIYSEMVGNLCQDAASSRKYWHLCRLMGRSASHVTLEVALRTKPAIAIISEEMSAKGMTLPGLIALLAGQILSRERLGMQYGVLLIPEGLLEFLPDTKDLLGELGILMRWHKEALEKRTLVRRVSFVSRKLTKENAKRFRALPARMQEMLTLNRDSHGNVKVSQLPTEELLAILLRDALAEQGIEFKPILHFFGYEGRCGAPSEFDAYLGYNLGLTAGSLVLDGRTGYMAAFGSYERGGVPSAVPIVGILDREERQGEHRIVMRKAVIDPSDPAFQHLASRREVWAKEDSFCSPGPRQYAGTIEVPITVALNRGYRKRGIGR